MHTHTHTHILIQTIPSLPSLAGPMGGGQGEDVYAEIWSEGQGEGGAV